ncbi:MAG: glycine--tRNA ligase subunit beta [Gammaproteobacteria bacterium]
MSSAPVRDFLVELGTEELPPKSLKALRDAFRDGIIAGLSKAGLSHGAVHAYAAPRRLAVRVESLIEQQPDRTLNIDGPPVKAAFDAQGNPTQAALGFAKKNGVEIGEVDRSGDKLRVVKQIRGEAAVNVLPGIVQASLDALPIAKRMRWGARRIEFVRPSQWLLMLFGTEVVDCELLGQRAGNQSRGHRFHHPDTLVVGEPKVYLDALRKAHVIADFDARRADIRAKVEALAAEKGGTAIIPEALLDEVTALVEWPVPLACTFEKRFLDVPQEALISTMQDNQKYFCLVDKAGKLLPVFVTVANIDSPHPEYIVAGNEKVVRPRLTDAEFFYRQDLKVPLAQRNERLKTVVFQAKLGTTFAKAERVSHLAAGIARRIGGNRDEAAQAGLLCKADLATELVGEFPELQGIAGRYYATAEKLPGEVAAALDEQYMPRFAGDQLPKTKTGQAVAVADKLDTLAGIFGINQPPTGDKDPFALRRATLGVLRIVIERELDLDLGELVGDAAQLLAEKLENANTRQDVLDFIAGRYPAYFAEQGIATDTVQAALAVGSARPLDVARRVKAVQAFRALPEAAALAAANKRVGNILAKDGAAAAPAVDNALLVEDAEKPLAARVAALAGELEPLFAQGDYTAALGRLAGLRAEIDTFFDKVMVNAEDAKVRANRLALLAQLRGLFLRTADIGLLQG